MNNDLIVDTTKIDFTNITEYISIDTKLFLNILKQLSTIINLKASKLSRGITLKVWDNNTVLIICPNEIYFFNAEVPCTTTFTTDTCIYLDYTFLQKLTRFFLDDIYIFKLNDKFYLRLNTGNLELINTYLIDSEKDKLSFKYEITDTKYTYQVGNIYNKLNSLYNITDFEIEFNRRWVNSNNGVVTFKSPLLVAKSNFDFINAKIDYKILNYLIYLCSISNSTDMLEIYEVKSAIIPKYAIKYNNTIMISNYPASSTYEKTLSLFDDLPAFTMIDYSDLKYKLEYADSITYAKGVVTFINRDNKLIGKIKLTNNSETEVEIPVLGQMYLKQSQQIKVNFKTLLVTLNALDSDLETYLGIKDGMLYLINSDISLAMVTF